MTKHAACLVGIALSLVYARNLQAADVSTTTYPFLGVTHITRTGSAPDFPRNVKIHVVTVDLTAPLLSFEFTPHSGTRDTQRQTTLQYLNNMGAQLAINGSFFLPFPSNDFNSALVGFAASNGTVYSPFELPTQNYALVRDSPAINIDPNNTASIVHRDPAQADGRHVRERVELWTVSAGSAQIVT